MFDFFPSSPNYIIDDPYILAILYGNNGVLTYGMLQHYWDSWDSKLYNPKAQHKTLYKGGHSDTTMPLLPLVKGTSVPLKQHLHISYPDIII